MRAKANARGVRLAGCESMTALEAFRPFLDAGAYDAIMPDVKYAGGLAEMLRIGDEARRRGVMCSPHNPTGPIAHLASVHVAMVLDDCPFLEFQYGESALFFELCDRDIPDPNRRRERTAARRRARGRPRRGAARRRDSSIRPPRGATT